MLKIRKFELQDKALPFCAAQKVGEEGVETALAATVHDREELTNEVSVLIYYLLVLLQDQDLSKVIGCLRARHQKPSPFALTLTLSRRERGSPCPHAACAPPLPLGEGRGEGLYHNTESYGEDPAVTAKVGEEGVETGLAATVHDREELTNEVSVLIYHLLVLLQDLDLSKVIGCLRTRHQKSSPFALTLTLSRWERGSPCLHAACAPLSRWERRSPFPHAACAPPLPLGEGRGEG